MYNAINFGNQVAFLFTKLCFSYSGLARLKTMLIIICRSQSYDNGHRGPQGRKFSTARARSQPFASANGAAG